jgi:hypothetical protein
LKLSCCGFVCTILLFFDGVVLLPDLPLFFCLVLEQKVLIMPSTANKKQAPLSQPQSSNPKRAQQQPQPAKGRGKVRGASKSLGMTLLTLGFLLSKRPPIHIGTKVLLNESIYRKARAPAEVKNHLFVYKVLQVNDIMGRQLWFFKRTKSSDQMVTCFVSTGQQCLQGQRQCLTSFLLPMSMQAPYSLT